MLKVETVIGNHQIVARGRGLLDRTLMLSPFGAIVLRASSKNESASVGRFEGSVSNIGGASPYGLLLRIHLNSIQS